MLKSETSNSQVRIKQNMLELDHRILVIDDEELFRELVENTLASFGYPIDCVEDYHSAIEKLQNHEYSLVVLDYMFLSNKTGFDVIKDFAAQLENTQIIIVTGNPSMELAIEALEHGVYDFLTKPADLNRLKLACRRALDYCGMQRQQKQMTIDLIEKNQELKIANSQLLSALEEAKTFQAHLATSKKMAGVGEMTASVAHEFNNILGAIRGYTQLASRKQNDSKFLLDSHIKIKEAVDKAIKVVRNLLMFSKRIKPEFENANLNDAINETITLAQHHLELNEIEIIKRMNPVQSFRFDIGQLQQVFLNLITNATHAMKGGGKLLIETFIEDKSAIVKFTDNGAGIENDLLEKIWIPFFTTKDKNQDEEGHIGSGLGLYVSRQIIESHKGSIEVSSTPNKGTIFTLKIPLDHTIEHQSEDDIKIKLAEIEKALNPQNNMDSITGLGAMVVDDEADIRHVLVRFLEDKGFVVSEASDGQQCLEHLRNNPQGFHLIFMDLNMPNIDGEQALHVIKDEFPQPSVFMMSGFGGSNSADKMLALGAERYISKPFDLDELDEFIDQEMKRFHTVENN